jgi:ectoine hydroxylase-related dioxygenase (phytanoyl-CoA dioxygenase family)
MEREAIDQLKSAFARDGFVILRNILRSEDIAALHADIDSLMAEKGHPSALSSFGAAMTYPNVLKLVEHDQVLPVVVNLLGYNLQLHLSSLSVKRPVEQAEGSPFEGGKIQIGNNAGSLNWHRDGPSPQFPFVQDVSVKVCFILSDLTEPDRGNTKVLPGSHRDRTFRPPHGDASRPLPGEVQICGAPGDVMIFAQNLWHGAGYNLSTVERRLAFIGYSACWMRPVDYQTAPALLLDGASPNLRQLLGDVGPTSFHHYMPENMPLKDLWLGEEPVNCYAH